MPEKNTNEQQAVELLASALKQLMSAEKNDPVQSLGAPPYLGSGTFTQPGVAPDMWSTVQKPRTGFLDALPLMRSEFKKELVSILTGQDAGSGSNPSSVCGTPPVTGQLRECKQLFEFGEYFIGSEKVKVTEIGKLEDRGVVPRTIYNYAASNTPWVPEPLRDAATLGGTDVFRNELLYQYYRLGNEISRAMAQVVIDGNGSLSNSATARGFVSEFDGLSRLVKQGYTDASTGDTCTAADSHIIEWDGTNVADTRLINGRTLNIVEALNEMFFSRTTLADRLGIDAQWAIVMDMRLFPEIAYVFAATYSHQRYDASTNATETTNRERAEIERRYQDMISGYYLPLYNMRVPVLFTSGRESRENDTQGGIVSDMYLVSMTANGAPTTYIDYFDLNNEFIADWNRQMNVTGRSVLNNGLYLSAIRSDGYCDEILMTAQPRLIHRTPFLSGRINDIAFNQYSGYRDAYPGTTYYYGGGTTSATPATSGL